VGIFPIDADGSPASQAYIDSLSVDDYAAIGDFMAREAHRYGRDLAEPVHIALYPVVKERPPELQPGEGLFATIWWSLKLRWFAFRKADTGGHAPPRIRMFVEYHDPSTLQTVPDSRGMQKGLIGVVHAFALKSMAGSNNIVITHELLHTLGATDKYDPATNQPLVPIGLGDPGRKPLYPQDDAEIMSGRRALSPTTAEMPSSLKDVVVGPDTALEIRWTKR